MNDNNVQPRLNFRITRKTKKKKKKEKENDGPSTLINPENYECQAYDLNGQAGRRITRTCQMRAIYLHQRL